MDDLDSLPPDDDLPLRGLIDHGATATPRPDALREIVARQERWRVRTLAGVLAAVLIGGPISGYALAQVGSSPSTAVAARANSAPAANSPSPATNALSGAVGGSASGGYVTGVGPEEVPATPARQLFIRTTADGVRIRGYLQPFPKAVAMLCSANAYGNAGGNVANGASPAQPPAASPGSSANVAPAIAPAPPCPAPPSGAGVPDTCLPTDSLQAQVSNDQVAGATEAMPFPTTGASQALTVLDAQIVGAGDPTPIGTVLVKTGAGVASVRLTVTGGSTDSMAPVDGYGIVAANMAGLAPASTTPPTKPPSKTPSAGGTVSVTREVGFGFPKTTVEALDAAGKVLASVELPGSITESAGPPCGPVVAPGGPPTPAGAPGSSTGSGTVSSGGAGSSGASYGGVSSSGSTSAGSSTAPAGASASSQG